MVSSVSTPQERLDELRESVRGVVDESDADVILYSGAIYSPDDDEIIRLVRSYRSRPNVLMHLTTNGGNPDSAYRIARCLQRAYEGGKFILFVDTFCKSAGTLIALGADEIVMSVMAELGPLDVQLSKPDALAEQTSGLTPKHAINTLRERSFESLEDFFLQLRFRTNLQITTHTALEVASTLTTGLFSPIFEQIDPMRLGEISRAMLIAEEYGKRLLRGNEHSGTLERLIEGYPSHGFVIDREEAKDLFQEVRAPTSSEERLAALVESIVEAGQKSRTSEIQFLSVLAMRGEEGTEASSNDEHDNEGSVHKTIGGEGAQTSQEASKSSPSSTGTKNSKERKVGSSTARKRTAKKA